MGHLAFNHAPAVVSVTVTPQQHSCSHAIVRMVSVLVSRESMDQTVGSVLLDTGTTEQTDAGVSERDTFNI